MATDVTDPTQHIYFHNTYLLKMPSFSRPTSYTIQYSKSNRHTIKLVFFSSCGTLVSLNVKWLTSLYSPYFDSMSNTLTSSLIPPFIPRQFYVSMKYHGGEHALIQMRSQPKYHRFEMLIQFLSSLSHQLA